MDFPKFYQTWLEELHHLTNPLLPPSPTTDTATTDHHELVNKLMNHFSEYNRVISLAATKNILSIFSSRWSTTLEHSLHWIAGWRPTTLFHLIYTECGFLFESRMLEIIHGSKTGDLGDLSLVQLTGVSQLQCETVEKENAVTRELSEWQDDAFDVLTGPCLDVDKMGRLVKVVDKANELRLQTLEAVVELLTPQQAVELLAAAARLWFGIRNWGLKHDRERVKMTDAVCSGSDHPLVENNKKIA